MELGLGSLLLIGIVILSGIALKFSIQKLRNSQWFLSWKLSIQKLIDRFQTSNWKWTLGGGLILSVFSAGVGSIAEFVIFFTTIVLVPILLGIRKYFAKKLPEWLDKAVDTAIITFISSILATVLIVWFEHSTGFSLRVV